MKTIGNEIGFKTFRWLKANETLLDLPVEGVEGGRALPKDSHQPWEGRSYGVSEPACRLNFEHSTGYHLHRSEKQETIACPIQYIETQNQAPFVLDSHDIIAEEASELKLILWYRGETTEEAPVFRHSLIRVWAQKGARVKLLLVQADDLHHRSLESIVLRADEGAEIELHQYELGSQELYANTKSYLEGEKSKIKIDSVYFGTDEEKLDFLYEAVHEGKASESSVIVHGALDGGATKTLKSTLDFREGSHGAKGNEEEYVILLSDQVHAASVPALLSHEDDVEGNHAASAGKMDQDLLFYIMSRGFSYEEAKTLLIEAQFNRAVAEIEDDELRAKVWKAIYAKLK